MKRFRNHGGIYRFMKKFSKDSGESIGRTRVVTNSVFAYLFVYPDLRVEVIFIKEGAAENGGIDFEIGDIGTSAQRYWRLK